MIFNVIICTFKNSDHFGEGYPWHTKTLKELIGGLENLSKNLKKAARVRLSFFSKYFDRTFKI